MVSLAHPTCPVFSFALHICHPSLISQPALVTSSIVFNYGINRSVQIWELLPGNTYFAKVDDMLVSKASVSPIDELVATTGGVVPFDGG